ncbi:MAG TPA: patatin-like phospholipase family protein [Mycobacteriales bacterium]|nr:patatin-like phospholipase family protein [Mycobacteriales bacterium]
MVGKVAFVLGGGGLLGAHEVGMLRALLEAGIVPDLVVGTSVGAINGVVVAEDPSAAAARRLADLWLDLDSSDLFGGSVFGRLSTLARTRTSLHTDRPLRDALTSHLTARTFEELSVPFQCVAANVERAAEHWFHRGPLIDAVIASCAVPGLLPPAEVDGQTYLDGGLVHSIPVGRAVALGATTLYVLQVGRIEQPLTAPQRPWEVGLVAFEVARRHRFASDMAALPTGVSVHVLPTGAPEKTPDLRSQLRYRDRSAIGRRIDSAYAATRSYLSG